MAGSKRKTLRLVRVQCMEVGNLNVKCRDFGSPLVSKSLVPSGIGGSQTYPLIPSLPAFNHFGSCSSCKSRNYNCTRVIFFKTWKMINLRLVIRDLRWVRSPGEAELLHWSPLKSHMGCELLAYLTWWWCFLKDCVREALPHLPPHPLHIPVCHHSSKVESGT